MPESSRIFSVFVSMQQTPRVQHWIVTESIHFLRVLYFQMLLTHGGVLCPEKFHSWSFQP